MENWADELIHQYKKHRNELQKQKAYLDRNDLHDLEIIKSKNSMIRDMDYVLEWLETGRQPGTFKGAEKKNIYQRQYFASMDFIPDIVEQLEEGPKQLYMTKEEKMILADIFASLSHRERQCYILHEARGVSMGKIAEEMGVSKGTVHEYIKRARKKVQQRVPAS